MNSMIQDVSIGGYIPGDSLLHRLDPRTKLAGLIVLLIGVFVSRTGMGLFINCCLVLTLIFLCGIGWRVWWWGLLRFSWMLLIAAVVNIVFNTDGQSVVFRQWELPITEQGVQAGFTLFLQLLQAIILSMALTFTTTPPRSYQRFRAAGPALETTSRAGGGSRRRTAVGHAVCAAATTGVADHY